MRLATAEFIVPFLIHVFAGRVHASGIPACWPNTTAGNHHQSIRTCRPASKSAAAARTQARSHTHPARTMSLLRQPKRIVELPARQAVITSTAEEQAA